MPESRVHVGVYGVVKRGDEIALILKAHGPYTGMLDLPGGKIEYGETVEECLKREILEELGCEVMSFQLRKVVQNSINYTENDKEINFQHVGIIFEATVAGEITSEARHDVVEAGWYEIEKLNDEKITFLVKEAKST